MAPCTQLRDSYRSYGSAHPAPASDDPAVLWVACAAAARKTWSMEIVARATWKNKCLGRHVKCRDHVLALERATVCLGDEACNGVFGCTCRKV